jgi:hypothetical protein
VFLALRYNSLELGVALLMPLCCLIISIRSALSSRDHYGLGFAPSLVYRILNLAALVIALINLVAVASRKFVSNNSVLSS